MTVFQPCMSCDRFDVWLLMALSLRLTSGSTSTTCLPGAVGVEHRKNLTTMDGESIPLGALVAGWRSAHLTSALFEITVSEIMGYNIGIPAARYPGGKQCINLSLKVIWRIWLLIRLSTHVETSQSFPSARSWSVYAFFERGHFLGSLGLRLLVGCSRSRLQHAPLAKHFGVKNEHGKKVQGVVESSWKASLKQRNILFRAGIVTTSV